MVLVLLGRFICLVVYLGVVYVVGGVSYPSGAPTHFGGPHPETNPTFGSDPFDIEGGDTKEIKSACLSKEGNSHVGWLGRHTRCVTSHPIVFPWAAQTLFPGELGPIGVALARACQMQPRRSNL